MGVHYREAQQCHCSSCMYTRSTVPRVEFEMDLYSLLEADGPASTCLVMNCEHQVPVVVLISSEESQPPSALGKRRRPV